MDEERPFKNILECRPPGRRRKRRKRRKDTLLLSHVLNIDLNYKPNKSRNM